MVRAPVLLTDGCGFESYWEYMSTVGVHVSHCCVKHGCKYGDAYCPVVAKTHKQKYSCEICDDEAEELRSIILAGKHSKEEFEGQNDNTGKAKVENPRNTRLRDAPYRKDNYTSRQEWEYNNSTKED